MKQFMSLLKLELVNILGLNVLRHTRDPREKRKKRIMLIVILAVIGVILVGYMAAYAYMLTTVNLAHRIPLFHSIVAMVLFLMYGSWRARGIIFRESDLDLCSSLPVSGNAIAAARFVRLYVGNLLIGIGMLVPGFVICGVSTGAGAMFYLGIPLACIVLPILPSALAAWFGIAVSAIVAHNRHKVLTEVTLAIVVVVGMMVLSMVMSSKMPSMSGATEANDEITAKVTSMIDTVLTKAERTIPPLRGLAAAILEGNLLRLLVFGLIAAVFLVLSAWIIGRFFFGISRRLYATRDHREFRLSEMKRESVMRALLRKESARYFSSGIYVSNTIIGPVMAVLFAVALAFFDVNKLVSNAGSLPFTVHAEAAIPYLISMMFVLVTISSTSLSMEGKHWWISLSLPLTTRDVMGAKIVFNLVFVAPFYAVAEIAMLFTVRATFLERLWILVIPAVMIVFSVVYGLFVNTKFPKFQWENAAEVVKQSASVALGMIAVFAALIPGGAVAIAPASLTNVIDLSVVLIVSVVTVLLYRAILGTRLERL